MKLPIKFLAPAILALLASSGYSSEKKSDVKAKQKWYRVEAIIFTQKDVFGDELTSRDIVMAYPENMIDLDTNHVDFTALPENERELDADVYSLKRTGVYKILFHKAWRQPGIAPADAPWINIDISDENTALSGSLRVYLSSYLHLESNLWHVTYSPDFQSPELPSPDTETLSIEPLNNNRLSESSPLDPSQVTLPHPALKPWPTPPIPLLPTPTTELVDTNTDEDNLITADTSPINPAQRQIEEIILLKQASRLKLNKLHYFDHPKMGLLLRVSRATAPVIESQEGIKTEEPSTISKALN